MMTDIILNYTVVGGDEGETVPDDYVWLQRPVDEFTAWRYMRKLEKGWPHCDLKVVPCEDY